MHGNQAAAVRALPDAVRQFAICTFQWPICNLHFDYQRGPDHAASPELDFAICNSPFDNLQSGEREADCEAPGGGSICNLQFLI
jgi:hypothetical protein